MQGQIHGSYSCARYGIGYIMLGSWNGRKDGDYGDAQNHGKRVRPFEDLQIARYKWVYVHNSLTIKIGVKFQKKQRK